MFRKFCAVAVALSAFAISTAFAVNGVAVSIAWRFSDLNWGAFNPKCPENNMYNWAERGCLVRFIINGSSITCDTIHNRTNGFALYPSFSLDGKRVAFYRYGWRLGKSPTSGRDTLLDKNNPSQIAVINIDGSGLRNLCALPAEPYSENALDWPAGDWIYYVRSRTNGARTMDIWRVNVTTGANESVCTLTGDGWIRRFTLSLKADRSAIQVVPGSSGSGANNGALCFPPANCNASSCGLGGAGSCNTSLSTSGGYVAGYGRSAHDCVDLTKLPGTVGPEQPWTAYTTCIPHLQSYTGQLRVPNLSGGSDLIAGDGELIRWAVNSDKWVLQQYGWWGHADAIAHGTNQVLINWVDKAGVVPSRNPKVPMDPTGGGGGVVYCGNCPGDFWVDGGAANYGKYEDANGVWNAVPGYVPTPATAGASPANDFRPSIVSIDAAGSLRITLPSNGRALVRLIDMRGKSVLSTTAVGGLMVPAGTVLPGMYLIDIQCAGREIIGKVSISR